MKTELNHDFETPDDKEFKRNLLYFLAMVLAQGMAIASLILLVSMKILDWCKDNNVF